MECIEGNKIRFDFLGKDSIRYENTVDVRAAAASRRRVLASCAGACTARLTAPSAWPLRRALPLLPFPTTTRSASSPPPSPPPPLLLPLSQVHEKVYKNVALFKRESASGKGAPAWACVCCRAGPGVRGTASCKRRLTLPLCAPKTTAPAAKKEGDQLFECFDAQDLNVKLKDLMDGLSVKVGGLPPHPGWPWGCERPPGLRAVRGWESGGGPPPWCYTIRPRTPACGPANPKVERTTYGSHQ